LEVHVAKESTPLGTGTTTGTGTGTGTARALAPTASALEAAARRGAVTLLNREPLDEGRTEWLDTLQGNILRGHGRTYGLHLLVRLPADATAAKRLIAALTRAHVTSAARQYREVQRKRRFGIPGGVFGTLALSSSGYGRLGQPVGALFPPQAVDGEPVPVRSLFAQGMRASHAALGDRPDARWEPAYEAGEIDALLILADNDRTRLVAAAGDACDTIEQAGGTLMGVEPGEVRRNDQDERIEHFGFVDGISQPLYVADDFQERPGQRLPSMERWRPFEPLQRVLVPDPAMAEADPRCHGSFLVLRKLEQNVRKFHAQLGTIADTLHLAGSQEARLDHAGALVVGRFRDGTPIVQQDHPGGDPQLTNDFTYDDDIRGGRCPMHAHIRKVNPRGHSRRQGDDPQVERRHMITRRSLPYGERRPDETLDTLPETGVGVLFMCYQASIELQFAFMQKQWCGTAWFPQAHVGVDALVGQDDEREILARHDGLTNESHIHDWPAAYGQEASRRAPFGSCVNTLGGEFFFVPSLPFLQSLG
jgi:Dyp-type peroxidase family